MLSQPAQRPQSPDPSKCIGVGIDTSRYGHYAVFLRDDLQPAAAELQFAESAAGYALLRQRLEKLAQQLPGVRFLIRLDVAGQYADNLMRFLQQLSQARPQEQPLTHTSFSISTGDP